MKMPRKLSFDLHTVAALYSEAWSRGDPPVKAVRDGLGCSSRSASNYVEYARKAGLILVLAAREVRPTDRPLAPAVAVSDALGVSYEALIAAVRKFAPNGRLIVSAERAAITAPVSERPIESLHLPTKPYNCLRRDGRKTLGDLANCTEDDLLATRTFGPEMLQTVQDALAEVGLSLKK